MSDEEDTTTDLGQTFWKVLKVQVSSEKCKHCILENGSRKLWSRLNVYQCVIYSVQQEFKTLLTTFLFMFYICFAVSLNLFSMLTDGSFEV